MSHNQYFIGQAIKSLQKKSGFVASVVATMAITLGALLCVLTLAYYVFFKPLPYPDQAQLVKVSHQIYNEKGDHHTDAYTYPALINVYKTQTVFEQSALAYYDEDIVTSIPSQAKLTTAYVTPEWFSLTSVPMALGRPFEQTENLDTNNPVAILSYQTWQTEFDGNRDILSEKISLSGISYQIVGVVAADYIEPQIHQIGLNTGIWLPWDFNLVSDLKERWTNISPSLVLTAKLKPSISLEQASLSLTPAANELYVAGLQGIEFFKGWTVKIALMPFKTVILGENSNTLYLLLAGVVGLLIIAVANIANLFIARTVELQRTLAINAVLGATKRQLQKLLFIESALLMLVSTLIALVIASAGFALLQQYLSDVLPRVNELSLNSFTIITALFFCLVLAALFSFAGKKIINYQKLSATLQSSGKGTSMQVSSTTRKFLIISQVSVATSLIFINIVLFKHAVQGINLPLAFSTDNTISVSLSYSAPEWPERDARVAMVQQLKTELQNQPEIERVSFSRSPLSQFGRWLITDIESNTKITTQRSDIDEQYLPLIEQPIIAGDNFSEEDIKNRHFVFIVNETFAKMLAPNGDVVGRKFEVGAPEPLTIIGVVKSIRTPGSSEMPIRAYTTSSPASTRMLIKFKAQQSLTRQQLIAVLQKVDPLLVVYSMETLEETKHHALFSHYVTVISTATLAILTFCLAAIGLYGILSYSTQMRRAEIGTRMAIGAKGRDLILLVLRDNGIAIGVGIMASAVLLSVGYFIFKDALQSYISLQTLPIFLLAFGLMSLVTFIACYWPLKQYINKPAIFSLRNIEL